MGEQSITFPIDFKTGTRNVTDPITYFANDDRDMAKYMTKPDPDAPIHTQYIIWMDQAGDYMPSSGSPRNSPNPDALVVIAQQGRGIEWKSDGKGGEEGWQTISCCGTGGSWFASSAEEIYKEMRRADNGTGGCYSLFQWYNRTQK